MSPPHKESSVVLVIEAVIILMILAMIAVALIRGVGQQEKPARPMPRPPVQNIEEPRRALPETCRRTILT
jgi:flagellar biosynthesis/type III secretory pathway M-ring protein FliF/YscJ